MATAGGYAVLGLAGTTAVNNLTGTINGSVGILDTGPTASVNDKTVNGNVVDANASWFSNKGTITAGTSTNAAGLAQSAADAMTAFNQAITLTPTQTFSGISSPTTFTGSNGLNVISIAGDITNSLTLNGSAKSIFVVLVGGTLALGANESLALSGGVGASNVLYVFDGPNGTVTTAAGDVVNGTLLASTYSFTLNGTFNGAILSGGRNISVMNAVVNANPFVGATAAAAPAFTPPAGVPEPATYWLTGIGFLAVLVGRGFRRSRARLAQSR
jgi:hypothetical protein